MIYGVATLAACTILGKILGSILGEILGTGSDIGGVGFGMLLLLFVTNSCCFSRIKTSGFSGGIQFWKKMFLPIVIAMSASQNIYRALSSGFVAILAGLIPVAVAFLVLSIVSRFLKGDQKEGVTKDG